MDLFEAIEKRHSYRGRFLDRAVPRDDLKKIVQAGIQAPSGCNAQTPVFVIIDDPDKMKKLAEYFNREVVSSAPACIVCAAEDVAVFENMSFATEDYSAAVENILLAVTALGYATVWLDGILRRDGLAEKVGELVGLPQECRVRVVLPIGCPAEQKTQKEKKPFGQRAWFNSCGG